ncbi:DNA replication licensing factor MCM4 [Yarrowia sp. E02]|nr:DNA replication licensing factor MCM4 [Yarrowia sp. E02]
MSNPSSPMALGSSPQRDNTSSPLFMGSSNPPSEIGGMASSPAMIPSSGGTRRLLSSTGARQGGGAPSSRGAALLSDLDSTPTRATAGGRQPRGDIFSSDINTPRRQTTFGNGFESSPMRLDSEGLSSTGLGLQSDNNISSAGLMPSEGVSTDGNEPRAVLWGTDIAIPEVMAKFRRFLMHFKPSYRVQMDGTVLEDIGATGQDTNSDPDRLYYVIMLQQMHELGMTNLNLDMQNLLAYPPTASLYRKLVLYPQEIIPLMDQTIKDVMVALLVEGNDHPEENVIQEVEQTLYKVRPYGLGTDRGMRELNPSDIDNLVCVKGLSLRSTQVIPDMKEAVFKCSVCNHTEPVQIERGIIAEPVMCPRTVCQSRYSMQILHNRSIFGDKQVVRLQETPDVVPDGQTPHTVSLCVYDELVDACKAGDRVQVTGIYRSVPTRVNPRNRTIRSLFKTYIDVVHVQKTDKTRVQVDTDISGADKEDAAEQNDVEETRKITRDEMDRIKEVSERPDLYDLMSRSLAPSIYEHDDVKKGILLQLFGGTNKTFTKGGGPKYRGDINVLLCGDPSTSKSQLLQYVHKIAPRGVYTSGKGSSAVGLTAYVARDPDTRQPVLESGALVLSDGGVCCIDEFDKMSDATRSVLHEVMEQQTVSIAKAGIITTLNARTSIIASANPIDSRYNPDLPVTKNIDLPPTLLSRFDLVYLMLDRVDERVDRHLATHIANMYLDDNTATAATGEILPVDFLTLYLSYARANVFPQITPDAKERLVAAYVEMRKQGDDPRSTEKRITATTRQLESMIRLSEAHAKMRLSSTVEVSDVDEAVRLIRAAIKDYATDPVSGRIDMDLIQTGTSLAQRTAQAMVSQEIERALESYPTGEAPYNEVQRKVMEITRAVTNEEFSQVVQGMQNENKIRVTGEGPRRRLRLLAMM